MRARAYSPAGLSGIFAAHTEPADPLLKGARGAGIALAKGVRVEVEAEEAEESRVRSFLNGREARLGLVERVCRLLGVEGYDVVVRQWVEVPMGGGLGTSGASALATALALAKALGIRSSYLRLAQVAHVAEIEEGTGLGTVSGLVHGGLVVVEEPGAPGYDRVDRILVEPGVRVVIGYFSPVDKRGALGRVDLERVNRLGLEALDMLKSSPCLETFIEACRWFASNAGFTTPRLLRAIEAAEAAGALGASQAMIGETVFALAREEEAGGVAEALGRVGAETIVTEVEWGPARLVP